MACQHGPYLCDVTRTSASRRLYKHGGSAEWEVEYSSGCVVVLASKSRTTDCFAVGPYGIEQFETEDLTSVLAVTDVLCMTRLQRQRMAAPTPSGTRQQLCRPCWWMRRTIVPFQCVNETTALFKATTLALLPCLYSRRLADVLVTSQR